MHRQKFLYNRHVDIIPVIDLKQGQVVHARHGQRDLYRPIQTPLCAGSAPRDVVAGLLKLHPFRSLYIADLDAIEGQGSAAPILRALRQDFPDLDVWVDAGMRADGARDWLDRQTHGRLVLGSESQNDAEAMLSLTGESRVCLSLDFKGDVFQGPQILWEDVAFWPTRLIAMTLARVGSETGPDLSRVAGIVARAGHARRVYAAGGVRNVADLERLQQSGASGALVATALHGGTITQNDLRRF
ncbi:Phosphoribosylformimino-5-aminoimidazole carboxamide isomerase family protein [Granulibacter bethesdensis CGDNIH4]|nr:Phosphoribosylformimino-5-aminoimidazole carboxamide isomerase family protein [Granulibacter bethesdensis CGDNIH4]